MRRNVRHMPIQLTAAARMELAPLILESTGTLSLHVTKRLGRFASFTDRDSTAVAGAQLVEHDKRLGLRLAVGGQFRQRQRHHDAILRPGQAGMMATERDFADNFSDSHDRRRRRLLQLLGYLLS